MVRSWRGMRVDKVKQEVKSQRLCRVQGYVSEIKLYLVTPSRYRLFQSSTNVALLWHRVHDRFIGRCTYDIGDTEMLAVCTAHLGSKYMIDKDVLDRKSYPGIAYTWTSRLD